MSGFQRVETAFLLCANLRSEISDLGLRCFRALRVLGGYTRWPFYDIRFSAKLEYVLSLFAGLMDKLALVVLNSSYGEIDVHLAGKLPSPSTS